MDVWVVRSRWKRAGWRGQCRSLCGASSGANLQNKGSKEQEESGPDEGYEAWARTGLAFSGAAGSQ